jgi:hypothetical protein
VARVHWDSYRSKQISRVSQPRPHAQSTTTEESFFWPSFDNSQPFYLFPCTKDVTISSSFAFSAMMFQPPATLTHPQRYACDDDDEPSSSSPPSRSETATNTNIHIDRVVTPSLEAVFHIDDDDDDGANSNDGEDDDMSYSVEVDQPPYPLSKDHVTNGNNDRHIFMTLYIMLALALGGLAFAISRYVLILKRADNNSMTGADETVIDFDRDTTEFKGLLQTVLSGFVKSSVLLDASSPQAQAIEWMVFEDQMLTMENLTVAVKDDDADPFAVYQRYALMALFFATNGELWEETPWTENGMVHTCDFAGVDCDENDQVVLLDLFLRKLRGRIPDDLGLLTQLTSISLNSNLLEGSIPSLLFEKLTNLGKLTGGGVGCPCLVLISFDLLNVNCLVDQNSWTCHATTFHQL